MAAVSFDQNILHSEQTDAGMNHMLTEKDVLRIFQQQIQNAVNETMADNRRFDSDVFDSVSPRGDASAFDVSQHPKSAPSNKAVPSEGSTVTDDGDLCNDTTVSIWVILTYGFLSLWKSFKAFNPLAWLWRLVPGVDLLYRIAVSFTRKGKALEEEKTELGAGVLETETPVGLARENFWSDFCIGLSTGAMSVPHAISCAGIVGVSYQMGLYANLMYPILYFIFGSARHVVAGTAAVENLMVGDTVTQILGDSSMVGSYYLKNLGGGISEPVLITEDIYTSLRDNTASALAVFVGMVYIVLYLFRLSIFAELLADSVLSGFSTAAAFIVMSSQFKHALGMSGIKSNWNIIEILHYIFTHLGEIKWTTVAVFAVSCAFLVASQKLIKRGNNALKASGKKKVKIPNVGPLFMVIIATVVSVLAKFEDKDIAVAGDIPPGAPGFRVPSIHWSGDNAMGEDGIEMEIEGIPVIAKDLSAVAFFPLLVQSFKLAILFYVIHMAVAKTIANRQGYVINNRRELSCFSLINLVGGFFNTYPSCTSMSRSVTTEGLGAYSQLHTFGCSGLVLCVMLWLAPYLYYLPQASLAAVVVVGIFKMLEFEELVKLYHLQMASWSATARVKQAERQIKNAQRSNGTADTTAQHLAATTASVGVGRSSPDLFFWIIAFLVTFCWEATYGIIVSVVLCVLFLVLNNLRPEFVHLGRWPHSHCFRNVKRFSHLQTFENIFIYRIDAPLNFANAHWLEDKICSIVTNLMQSESVKAKRDAQRNRNSDNLSDSEHDNALFFILDCSSVVGLDITALECLRRTTSMLKHSGFTPLFSNWKGPQRDFLCAAGFYDYVTAEHCFMETYGAVAWAMKGSRADALDHVDQRQFGH